MTDLTASTSTISIAILFTILHKLDMTYMTALMSTMSIIVIPAR